MNKVNSLGLFVGTGDCNAHCKHCAGVLHRKYAPKQDGTIDKDLLYKTIKSCYEQGARSISISSSGEPTLSPIAVTKVLDLIHRMQEEDINYSWINLYSNGIRIGNDKEFCNQYLGQWRNLGLQTLYITVHDLNEKRNAKVYGVAEYPSLKKIVSRIHSADLRARANVVLTRDNIGTCEKYISMAEGLRKIGFDHVSAWPIRNADDKMDLELSPSPGELEKMGNWAETHETPNCRLRVLREKSHESYEKGEKLTLFPDGTLSNTWCN